MPSNFGTTPLSTTTLGTNQFPISAGFVPNTASGNLTSLQLGPASTDTNGYTSAPVAVYIADGSSLVDGATTDVAVTGDVSGTISAKLRGLNKIFAQLQFDGSNNLKVNITTGTVAATQSGAWNITNISGTISLPTGAAQDATVAKLNISPSTSLGSNTGPLIQGSVTTGSPTYTTGNINPLSLTTAGALRVDASATTQPISAVSLPLPTGAATSAKQPALGTAGSASTDVLTIQGITSMTPLAVSGTFWQATQPVSGSGNFTVVQTTGTNLHAVLDSGSTTSVTQATASNLNAQVVGSVASGASNAGNPVKVAAVYNSTQPTVTTGQIVDNQATARGALIVATGVDAFAVNASQSGSNWTVNTAQVNGTTTDTNTGNASAGTQRVVLASNQPAIPASQSGSWTVTANAGTGTFNIQQSNITTDYDTGAGTQTMTMFGMALPASGGAVAGGTSSNPVRIDPTGVTTQPVSVASLPALPAHQSTNVDQWNGTTVDTNSGNKSAGTVRVVIATDQPSLSNALSVSQSGSWTVTANAGTNLNTSALALDTSVNGILLSQASTTSGQKGPLIQGAVTTNAPTYVTAQTSPLSLDTTGLLRVSLKDTPTNTNNLNVALAASSATVTVSASGNFNNATVGSTGSAVPASATYVGANKSGNLTGLSLDGSGNLNVNVAAGSSGNAAASATGSAVPASADYLGINVAGTLRGQTGVNPSGSIYAGQVDLASVAGSSVATAASGIMKVGLTDGSGTAITSTSNAIDVNIKSGGGSGFSVTDEAAWTAGTSALVPTGGVFNDSATALTSGQEGTVRLTNNRAIHVNLRDASANQLLGSKTSANSIPVVVASDQGAIPVSQSGTWTVQPGNTQNSTAWLTQDAADGTVAAGTAASKSILAGLVYNTSAPAPTNGQQMAIQADQAGNMRVFPGVALTSLSAWNSGTSLNATQTIFTNSGTPAVLVQLTQTTTITAGAATFEVTYDGSNWLTIPANDVVDPTSTTFAQIGLPYTLQASTNKQFLLLMNGAQGLRVKLSTQISGTGTATPNYALLAKSPLGQVVALSPTAANFQVTANAGTNLNTSSLALESGGNLATLAGGVTSSKYQTNVAQINGVAPTMGNGVSGTGVQRVTIASDSTGQVTLAAGSNTIGALTANQSVNIAQVAGGTASNAGQTGAMQVGGAVATNNNVSSATNPLLIAGSDYGGTPKVQSLKVDSSGNAQVAVTNTPTVTANIGTSGSLALDATVAKLNVAQSAALGSNTGPMVQASVTTNAPTYTTGNINPLSLDTAGLLRVSIKDTPSNTNNLNVALAASSATVTVTASNLQTNLNQIAGSAISTAASGIQKVGIVGNSGATVDSTIGAGTAPTNALVAGSVYNSSAPAPTNGQAMALQSDQAGNIRTFPGIALAALSAWNSGTSLNATQNIFTNSGAAAVLVQLTQTTTLTAGAITFEVSYDNSNWSTIPASCVLDPTSTTFAQISLPYTVQASTNKSFLLNMNGAQGLRIKLSTQISGSGSVTPNYALLPLSPADTVIALSPTASNFNVSAAQSGTWNINNVSGTVSLPTGAATAAKQPALGTAGSASSDVITVQGIASMTALKVDGSGVTQTVNGTVTANIGTTNGLALDTSVNGILLSQGSTTSGQKGSLIQGAVTTNAPSYTTAQTSPLSLDTSGLLRASLKDTPSNTNNLNVNIAASAATVTVSGTVTANQGGSNWSTNVAQIGGTNVVTGGASGLLAVGGPVASGASNADNPVKMGGAYNSTQPTVTTGQIVDAQMTARGAQIVATGTDTFNATINTALPAGSNIIGKVGIDQTTIGTTNGTTIVNNNTGSATAAEVTATKRLRIQMDSTQIFYDAWDSGTVDTTYNWNAAVTGGNGSSTPSTGQEILSSGTTASGYAYLTSKNKLQPVSPGYLQFDHQIQFTYPLPAHTYAYWGAGTVPATPTSSAPLTDAVAFELATNGKMSAVCYASGTRNSIQDLSSSTGNSTQPTDANIHKYEIYMRGDNIYWLIDNQTVASIATGALGPNTNLLPVMLLSGVDATGASSAQQLTSAAVYVGDTSKAFSHISDPTHPQYAVAVKPGSTAAASTDTSLVVGISPNSPLPTGSNTIGAVTQASGPWTENLTQIAGSSVATAATGVQKVGVVGNAGATIDSTVGAGTAPTNAIVAGAVYNSSAPAPTNGQAMAVQSDQAGNIRTFPGIALTTLTAWNSSTGLNATQTIFTNSGCPAVLVQLDQTTTLTAGAVTFESTYDGSNWVTVPANCVLDPTSISYAQISIPYTVQASTNKPFIISNNGWQGLRVKLSTQITGTGTVTPNYALLAYDPLDSVVAYSPTAANFNATVVQSGTWTVQPGNTPNTSAWLVQDVAGTSGGSTPYHLIAASSDNATNVKGSAGLLYGISISNTNAAARYFKIYDKATAPASTDTPKSTIQIPGNGTVIRAYPVGLTLSSGLGFRTTTGVADNDTGSVSANDLVVDLDYK